MSTLQFGLLCLITFIVTALSSILLLFVGQDRFKSKVVILV